MSQEPVEVPEIVGQYAGFWPRVGARMIDLAIIGVAYGIALYPLTYAVAREWAGPVAMVAVPVIPLVFAFVYLAYFTARSGETPGKRFMGLRVQRDDGEPVDLRSVLTRCAIDAPCCTVLSFVGLLDYLLVLGQRKPRAVHDLAAGTVVRHVRPLPATWWIVIVILLVVPASNVVNTKAIVLRGQMGLTNMAPTIRKGEQWLANRLTYRDRSPRVGDVVAFEARGHLFGVSGRQVGRVVGLAGDLIALRSGQVVRVAWDRNGLHPSDSVYVPQSSVAVTGDNRESEASAAYPTFPLPLPPPGFRGPDSFASRGRPILLIRTSDVLGQVQLAGRIIPIWGTRVVR